MLLLPLCSVTLSHYPSVTTLPQDEVCVRAKHVASSMSALQAKVHHLGPLSQQQQQPLSKCKSKGCKLTFASPLNQQRCHMSHLPSARTATAKVGWVVAMLLTFQPLQRPVQVCLPVVCPMSHSCRPALLLHAAAHNSLSCCVANYILFCRVPSSASHLPTHPPTNQPTLRPTRPTSLRLCPSSSRCRAPQWPS